MKRMRLKIGIVAFAMFFIWVPKSSAQNEERFEYHQRWRVDSTLGSLKQLSLHPDGKIIAATYLEDANIYLMDATDGRITSKFSSAKFKDAQIDIESLTWSHSGTFLASGILFETIEVWKFFNNQLQYQFDIALEGKPYFVRWSADDKYLGIVSENGGQLQGSIWDANTGKRVTTLSGYIAQLEWQIDGESYATVDQEGMILLRNLKDTQSVELSDKKTAVFAPPMAWSPKGQRLAINTSEPQTNKCSVEVIDLLGVKPTVVLEDEGTLYTLSWSPDGQLIAGGGYKRLRIWSLKSGQVLVGLGKYNDLVNSVSWDKNGKLLAIGNNDGSVQLLEVTYNP